MKNKFVKASFFVIGIIAISYGAFRITEYFTGVVRLKYAKIQIKKYDAPADETPIE